MDVSKPHNIFECASEKADEKIVKLIWHGLELQEAAVELGTDFHVRQVA